MTTTASATASRDNGAPAHISDELVTITEAADMVRTPVATLRYWRYLGTGPRSFRLGRRVMYRASDIEDWIQTQHDAADPTNQLH